METRSDSPRWLIDFQCPRCAGNVCLEETERIFTCAWCRVKLCLGSRGPLECYIPAPPDQGENALYMPYWRLKGMAYTCTAGSIHSGAVDLSHIALTTKTLPWSLGIQTQLARLRFLAPAVAGTFFAPTLTIGEAIAGCEANLKQLGIAPWTETALHRAWIGEQTSLLYYPFARRDGQIVDTLQGRIFESVGQWEARAPAAKQPDVQVRFYAATCPDCGDRAWKRESEGLEEMPFYVIPDKTGEDQFALPFWRIRVDVEGISLASFADYVRFCNLPRALTPSMAKTPFYFWVPAFKVNATLFLTLIRRVTLFQWQGEFEQRLGSLKCHPLTLPAQEGVESLKTALADLAADKRTFLPKLGDLEIAMKEALLVYMPFRARGGELIQSQIPLGIQRMALQYGLNI